MANSKDKYTYLKFEEVQSYKQVKRAADLFKQYFKTDFTFRSIIVANFAKELSWMVPDGEPEYTKVKEGADFTSLRKYFDRHEIALFVSDGKGKTANQMIRLEQKFIQMLESVHYKEAELVVAMKDKKITTLYPIITRDFVIKAVGNKSLNEV